MGWRRFLNRAKWDAERRREIESYVEIETADNLARGMSPEAARAAARRKFGNSTLVREEIYRMNTPAFFDAVWRNLSYALRAIRRNPGFAAIAVLTLAIGIGANTAIFSVVNGVLIEPLPYPDADRLIVLGHSAPGVNVADVSSAEFLYFTEREQNRTFEGVGLFGGGQSTVTGVGDPEQVQRLFATPDILPMLGIEPLLGRYFVESDDAPGAAKVTVLSYGYWQRRFGGDRSVLGRSITINGEPWTIIGVMPQRFQFVRGPVDLITPYGLDRSRVTAGGYFRRSIARLRPGVTLEQARADVARMIPIAIESYPPGPGSTREQVRNARLAPNLRPLKEEVVGDAGNILWVLMGTIGIVLLIACANVANLLLVRTEGRQQELSVRAALGAGWARIASELLTESIVLSLAGGVLGVALAYGGLRMLLAASPANLPRADEIGIDPQVLLFTLALSVFSGLLFGAMPVLRYARPRLAAALRAGGRTLSDSRDRLRARGVLVVAQVALALVLLVAAGLMIRTFVELNNVDPGFNAENVQAIRISIPAVSIPDPEQTMRREQEILDRLAALPGVTSVALASDLPMGGGVAADLIVPEGKTFGEGNPPRSAQSRFLSPGLFATLQMPTVRGRDLTWTDVYQRRPVVVISESLARREWGSAEEAMGKLVRGASSADQFREVVGVVGDVHDRGLSQPVIETVYFPALGERVYNNPVYVFRFVSYAIRSSRTGTPAFLDEVRQAVWSVDPNLPLAAVGTMGELVDASLARTSFTLAMLAIAGAMALLLGVIGIYGVIAYAVAQRTREVGIRLALGAQRGAVRSMFVRQGLALTAVGVVVGLAGAAALSRWMKALLFEVSPIDPMTYAGVALLLVLAAVAACYIPARRAASVDPVEALRAE